jgi:soluble lytic murein transglycosylase-like protein
MIRPLIVALALVGAPIAHAATGLIVLSPDDEQAYRAAYAALDANDRDAVDSALAAVSDQTLVGHVLARRLLSPGASPRSEDVAQWMDTFADEASAPAVAALARKMRISTAPPAPIPGRAHPLAARRVPGDGPAARAEIEAIAQAFAARDFAGARSRAQAALSSPRAGLANWWLGLISFRAGDFVDAAHRFEESARWPGADGWIASGALYWAGRSALAAGDAARAALNFTAAARWSTTFYGQLAEAQLGRTSPLDYLVPTSAPQDVAAFMARRPEARRAAALAQLGRLSDVEAELRLLHARIRADEDPLALALATSLQAPAAQLRIAEHGDARTGAGQCPVTTFRPEDGFRVDRAVIFAIMRQESRFVPVAISTSNARGLMQLLPSTAQHVDASQPYRRAPELLHDPGANMRLGQSYVEELAPKVSPPGNLAKVFAAYNGGPGWLGRWIATFEEANADPLLMLEALPREEPRTYTERVLAYMALCRKRVGQPAIEMDELASGKPPIYRPMDATRLATAR